MRKPHELSKADKSLSPEALAAKRTYWQQIDSGQFNTKTWEKIAQAVIKAREEKDET